ncbi:hypothetical protein Tco_0953107 [Tanacetum coccineum]|uniref:Uncharacterized protein n=1 Tax=Tanacetum coccineum TaxID=301880 RepID=A0ABQ5DZN2_9ASTR
MPRVFLAQISAKKEEDKSERKQIEDVPIVRDFPEVFPEDLPEVVAVPQFWLPEEVKNFVDTVMRHTRIVARHGIPASIICDRDGEFHLNLMELIAQSYGYILA